MNLKTFVVNMTRDVDKRNHMIQLLSRHPYLDYEVFPATEGAGLTKEELSAACDWHFFEEKNTFRATLPALGCSLSHIRIYREVAKHYDWALVLEDDASIQNCISTYIKSIIDYLETMDAPVVVLLTPGFGYYLQDKIFESDAGKLYRLKSGQMTSGYLINRRGSQLLAEKLMPVKYLADDWSQFIRMGLQLYGVVPHLISYPLEEGEIGLSQIAPKISETYWVKLKQRIFWRLRYCIGYRLSLRNW